MTHVLILYDGETGKRDDLPKFLKWIQSLSYDYVEKGVTRSYTVTPRLLIPINLRVCSKVKDRLLSDLAISESWRPKPSFFSFILNRFGLKKLEKVKPSLDIHNFQSFIDRGWREEHSTLKNVHIFTIGEMEDGINCYGEESL